jgi:hypothetical protein
VNQVVPHRRVLQLEMDAYVCRLETHKVIAETNPDAGLRSSIYSR